MIVVLLEATRRSVGWPLPIIAVVLIVYALWGRSLPGILAHPGNTWKSVVNHLYLTSQGIFGIALGRRRDLRVSLRAVRRAGDARRPRPLLHRSGNRTDRPLLRGPAKVSIFGSGLFGMISGSSIANTVDGRLAHHSGDDSASAMRALRRRGRSRGRDRRQITPPIMGAAAFLMVEYLAVPYQTIIVAAIVPAFMHFFGVFCQIHFEAKSTALRGLPSPNCRSRAEVIRRDWPTAMPLAVLLLVLFSDFTPYLAAFWGITGCIVLA